MNRRRFVKTLAAAQAQTTHRRPNILHFLADDLGYDDIACFGAKGVATQTSINGTNQFNASSSHGLKVTVSEPGSIFANFIQSPPGGWFGNFPAGARIIYDQSPSGPVKFTFATAVQGFGLTLDDAVGGGYTGTTFGVQRQHPPGFVHHYAGWPGLDVSRRSGCHVRHHLRNDQHSSCHQQ